MRATLLLLLFPPALFAAAPLPSAGDLVRRLGSNDFHERERAGQQLDETGAWALPALRPALASRDLEVRRRAVKLVRRIERREDLRRVLRPTRFRLSYKDVALEEALADLSRRAGWEVQAVAAPRGRRVTLDTGETTFWEALAQFQAAAGLTEQWPEQRPLLVESEGRRRRIAYLDEAALATARRYDGPFVLENGKPTARPTCQVGAVRLQIAGIAPDEAPGSFALKLRVDPEPHLAWQGFVALRIQSARDDQGQHLAHLGPHYAESAGDAVSERQRFVVFDARTKLPRNLGRRELTVRLGGAKKPARQVRELRGVLSGWVRTAPEELVSVPAVLALAEKSFAGKDGTVLRVLKVGGDRGLHVLDVEVVPPPLVGDLLPAGMRVSRMRRKFAPAPDEPVAVQDCPLRLLDGRGRPLTLESATRSLGDQSGKVWYRLRFAPGKGVGAPERLSYVERRSLMVNLPFVFKDVPLSGAKR